MKLGVLCQSCGIEAPSRYVEFRQNIGALLVRYPKTIKGTFCKHCIHRHFWTMTGVTVGVGWFGIISVFVSPVYVMKNLFHYLLALGMPRVPSGAREPHIDEETFSRFLHQADEAFARIDSGQDRDDVARSIAPLTGLTPGQVIKCMATLAHHRQLQEHNPSARNPVPVPEEPVLETAPVPQHQV